MQDSKTTGAPPAAKPPFRKMAWLARDIAVERGLLAWPKLHACRQLMGEPEASYQQVVTHPAVRACVKTGLAAHNLSTGGASSLRIARALLLTEPPSIDGNELTDKGYINQRTGLDRRAALVDRLYTAVPGDDVIVLR